MSNNNLIPSGWYFCAESSEIKSGQIVAKKLFGEKIILWRTQSGTLNASHSICPHLGSDLSKLGKIKEEFLQCFSHDYTYNGRGDCVATGVGLLPSCHKQVLKSFPVQEKGGFVLIWYDHLARQPSWQIPVDIFNIPSHQFIRSDFKFKVPIEIINEDNFDVGHLYKWHHVFDVRTTPVELNQYMISISHCFKRHSILFKKPLKPPFNFLSREINSKYSSTLYGHGLTNSFIYIFNFDIHLQDLIWCTPINAEQTMYTTFIRLLPSNKKRKFLSRWGADLLRYFIFRACVFRMRQEHKHEGFGFWENQNKVLQPILTEKEFKLIGPYRTWCTQFVSE